MSVADGAVISKHEAKTPAPEAGPPGAGAGSSSSALLASDPLGVFGTTVGGRFAVVRYLGRTSVAHIYRAVHMLMERPCFLKITERDASVPDGLPPAMRREAQAAGRVKHPAILRLIDAGADAHFAHITQEWSDGPNLRALIQRPSEVGVPDLIGLGMQLLDALCELHRVGLVLRAFDPERILTPVVNGKQVVRLFDLSRIAFVGEKVAQESIERSKRPTGFAVRSTRYMAPDEIREAPADPRSDLYSLGVLLYEMLTGEYPYATTGQGPGAYVLSHLREAPKKLDTARFAAVPQDLPGILERLLAKRPEDRFETAEAARRALEDVVVPDLMRLNTPADRHVLEAWRKRVKIGLGRTLERAAVDEGALEGGAGLAGPLAPGG